MQVRVTSIQVLLEEVQEVEVEMVARDAEARAQEKIVKAKWACVIRAAVRAACARCAPAKTKTGRRVAEMGIFLGQARPPDHPSLRVPYRCVWVCVCACACACACACVC